MEALKSLDEIVLSSGAHDDPESGMCVMEAFTYVNGLPWSDRPECACPVLAGFLRSWNDDASDEHRQALKRFIPLLLNTNDGKSDARLWILVDWSVREILPRVLDLLNDEKASKLAAELRSSAVIKAAAQLELAIPFIIEARDLDLARARDLARAGSPEDSAAIAGEVEVQNARMSVMERMLAA